jgi:hypothetical protein
VAIPTAILVAPSARRLAGHLTGTPRNSPPGHRQRAGSGERSQAKGSLRPTRAGQQGPNSLVLTARRDCNFNGVTPDRQGDTSDRCDNQPGLRRSGAVGG